MGGMLGLLFAGALVFALAKEQKSRAKAAACAPRPATERQRTADEARAIFEDPAVSAKQLEDFARDLDVLCEPGLAKEARALAEKKRAAAAIVVEPRRAPLPLAEAEANAAQRGSIEEPHDGGYERPVVEPPMPDSTDEATFHAQMIRLIWFKKGANDEAACAMPASMISQFQVSAGLIASGVYDASTAMRAQALAPGAPAACAPPPGVPPHELPRYYQTLGQAR